MQWSQVCKHVEDLFADSVRGRIRLHQTGYRRMHDELGRSWITVDGWEVVNMPHWYPWVMRDFIGNPHVPRAFEDYAVLFVEGGLSRAMRIYLTLAIDDILQSENVLVRAVGMLDRRLGKRTLRALKLDDAHPLIRLFHQLRCEAEGIPGVSPRELAANMDLRHPIWPGLPTNEEKKERLQRADAHLKRARKTRPGRSLLARLHRGELAQDDLCSAVASALHAGFERAPERDVLLARLQRLESSSKLLRSASHARGVIELCRDADHWLRPLEQWAPRSHNPDRQFSSLARHLWALYDVPLFMDRAWLGGNAIHQAWFRHIGAGKNICTADGLPVPLTKKMAHHFIGAPATYTIEGAFRWGQVLALGGDRRLADALLETRLVRDFRDNDFWLSVIRFFVRNPLLDPVHVQPIVDYLWNQRYEPRVEFVERGVARELGPEQPNLSMQGRTVASLLRAVGEWHRRLGRGTADGPVQWRKSAIGDFQFVEGSKESRNMKVWRIRELLSSKELIAEGRRMRHCVASYARSCSRGLCSIWSMEVETEEGGTPVLTMEVDHKRKEICQARGKQNRRPTDKEKDILQRWALQEGLSAGNYL